MNRNNLHPPRDWKPALKAFAKEQLDEKRRQVKLLEHIIEDLA